MLHAAAMLIGIFALAVVVIGRGPMPEALLAAALIAAACTLFAVRFGGVGKNVFAAPQLGVLGLSQTGAVLRGAMATLRAAVAADVTLKPALVRVKTRSDDGFVRAALATQMSAPPGGAVVETDDDGFLVHVINEDGVDASGIGGLEGRVRAALGERSTA